PDQVQAVHASSIAAVLDPGARPVTYVLRRCRATATISYDPNVRPTLMGTRAAVRERVEANLALRDAGKASAAGHPWRSDAERRGARPRPAHRHRGAAALPGHVDDQL